MKVDVTVPELAESITEAVIGEWLKEPGEIVDAGEQLVDIETDKVILEITAPASGELISINKRKNEQVQSNEIIAVINAVKQVAPASAKKLHQAPVDEFSGTEKITLLKPATEPAVPKTSPAVRKLAAENNVNIENLRGTGKDGRIIKQDIKAYIEASASDVATEIPPTPQFETRGIREDKRVPMTGLRKSIAKRLVSSQQESAMLTTFNEVNVQNVVDLRQRYQESFMAAHAVKLGFMSFCVKATLAALQEFPVLNASVEGDNIVYHDYFDIGIAVSTPRGLIVPIIRDADSLSFADIEKSIGDFALRARENKITIEDLTGGTFTITNGGVFGSMLSTPIVNPPQSAILGMHSIQDRPIAKSGQVIIAPMMYLALSYDHRIIDGKEAVQFLVHVKNIIEDPTQLLLQV